MPCRRGEVDGLQETVGIQMVELLVDARHRHRRQRRGRTRVDPHQITQPERRAAQCERDGVQRRCLREPGKRVAPALPVDQRVVLDRGEHPQPGIDATQQGTQVVVLPEERVEAAVHRQIGTVGGLLGPAADAATEIALPFDDVDGHSALDQPGRRGQPGDPAADDDDMRCGAQCTRIRQAGGCGVAGAARIGHRGASARKVCTMLRCQPGTVSLRTLVKPLTRSRFRNASAPSNSFTLRRRYR